MHLHLLFTVSSMSFLYLIEQHLHALDHFSSVSTGSGKYAKGSLEKTKEQSRIRRAKHPRYGGRRGKSHFVISSSLSSNTRSSAKRKNYYYF